MPMSLVHRAETTRVGSGVILKRGHVCSRDPQPEDYPAGTIWRCDCHRYYINRISRTSYERRLSWWRISALTAWWHIYIRRNK